MLQVCGCGCCEFGRGCCKFVGVLVVNFLVFVSVCGCCYDFVGVMSVILWVWLLGVCGCGCSEFVGVLVSLYVWL